MASPAKNPGRVHGVFSVRASFVVCVAVLAAAIADPIVETVSNTGWLGGSYSDHNQLGVIPTLLIGTLVLLEIVTLRCATVLHRIARERAWLGDVAEAATTPSIVRCLPFVFAVQLGALFVLESAEQLLARGAIAGGAAWLGGPLLFSLGVHALVGVGCAFGIASLVRSLVRAFASLVHIAIRFIWLRIARSVRTCDTLGRRLARRTGVENPTVRHIGGRAPPLLHALA